MLILYFDVWLTSWQNDEVPFPVIIFIP